MEVYIQRSSDGFYLTPKGHWKKNRALARKFLSTVDALYQFHGLSPADVELVIAFDGMSERYDVHLPKGMTRATA